MMFLGVTFLALFCILENLEEIEALKNTKSFTISKVLDPIWDKVYIP